MADRLFLAEMSIKMFEYKLPDRRLLTFDRVFRYSLLDPIRPFAHRLFMIAMSETAKSDLEAAYVFTDFILRGTRMHEDGTIAADMGVFAVFKVTVVVTNLLSYLSDFDSLVLSGLERHSLPTPTYSDGQRDFFKCVNLQTMIVYLVLDPLCCFRRMMLRDSLKYGKPIRNTTATLKSLVNSPINIKRTFMAMRNLGCTNCAVCTFAGRYSIGF